MIWWIVKGSIILALAFAASALLRRRPAAVRHAIWTVAIAAQLLLPLVPRAVPEAKLVHVPVRMIAPTAVAAVAPAASAVPAATEKTRNPLDLRTLFLAGSALLLLRLLYGTFRVSALSRRSHRVIDGEWLSLHSRLCDALRISRPVTLRQSDALQLPVTWGFLYPTILLPAASQEWPEALRRHVLLHELAHVRRADALTQLLCQAALVVYWCNPLLWLGVRRLRAEAENACDDYVLRDGELPSRYATTLVELVRAHTGPTLPALAALSVGQRSDLEVRVSAITNPLRDPSSRRVLLAAVIAVAVVIVVPLSALHPVAERPAAVAAASDSGCSPLLIKDAPFRESSGTMSANGVTTEYFFLRPEPDRCLEGSFNLDARFTDDDRDLVPTPGLRALVHETRGSVDRAVYVDEAGGRLAYRYLEGGRPSQWDGAAQRWYHDVMPDVIRRSEAGIDARAKRFVETDGVEGLFAELRRIPLPDVRTRYLTALLRLRTPAELPRSVIIDRAREELAIPEVSLTWLLTEVVYREGARDDVRADVLAATRSLQQNGAERSRVLKEMSHHPDPRVRVAAMDAIELLGPRWRYDLLQLSVPWYLGTNDTLVDAWFRGLDSIEKESERKELLSQVRQQELPREILIRAAE